MNFKPVFHVIAWLLGVVGILMGFCGLVSFLYGEPAQAWMALGHSAGGTLAVAVVMWLLTRNDQELSRRDGLGVVTFGWLLAGIVGAVPYVLSGTIASPVAALFETVSGLTTTGASVIPILETVPKGILLWRAITHLIGGMGILVLVVAILPFAGGSGMHLFRAETAGPTKDRIEPRMASTAQMLWGVYVLLIVVLIFLLRLGGMDWFDAACHSFATLATGGFSTRTASIAAYDSVYIERVLMAFMILGALNFALHYRALRGEFSPWWKDSSTRFFLAVLAASILVCAGVLHSSSPGLSWGETLRQTSFTCVSLATTTGFCTADFDTWPSLSKTLLLLLMLMGGCVGSTAGGIKVARIQMMLKTVSREIRLFMQPQAVIPVKMDRKFLDDDLLLPVLSFVALYLLVAMMGSMAMLWFAPNLATAVSSVLACMGGVGPGLSAVGPAMNYSTLPGGGLSVLMVMMLAGRLEFFTLLVIFMPAFWRK
ncbi:MAG TPA: potassium transporter [Verrucomicrobia bacterium]|nr:potassium transporter [Verrucomicrobiota bacterium]